MDALNPSAKRPSGGHPVRSSPRDSSESPPPSRPKPQTLHLFKRSETQEKTPLKLDGTGSAPQLEEIPLFSESPLECSFSDLPKPIPDRSGSPKTTPLPQEQPSPSARWDNLRRYVLSNQITSSDPPAIPRVFSPKPSSSSLRPGSSTPKPTPRFPRLGMRQVVEHARTAAADDVRKFTDDLERACTEARFGGLTKPPKVEREPTQGALSSYLSLSTTVTGSAVSLQSSGPHKQNSQQSVVTARPSVNPILRTLERYETSPNHRHHALPLANQVLSALLVPFLSPGTPDNEKELALQAFGLIIKSWESDTNEAELDRCLWCCKAASTLTKYTTEILSTLSSLLISQASAIRTDSPIIFQTLLQNLFMLQPLLASSPKDSEAIRELISQVLYDSTLTVEAIEQEFELSYSPQDVELHIRGALATESVVRCFANGSSYTRTWILSNVVEEYWPRPRIDSSMTPILSFIHSRKINTFARSALQLLSDPVVRQKYHDLVIRIIENQILPEAILLSQDVEDSKSVVVRLILQLLCIEAEEVGSSDAAAIIINRWYRDVSSWKTELEKCLLQSIKSDEIRVVIDIFNALKACLAEDVYKSIIAFCFPKFCERLVSEPYRTGDSSVRRLLQSIAKHTPQIFFKPLFVCSASNKDMSIANQLCILVSLTNFFPDLWTLDSEMISVALIGQAIQNKAKNDGEKISWDQARLGPTVILVELIGRLRAIRVSWEPTIDTLDSERDRVTAFATSLESRLSVLLDAKEARALMPFSLRILFCALFFEIKLLTRSLKSTKWLNRVISWVTQWNDERSSDSSNSGSVQEEVEFTLTKLKALYSTAQAGFQPNHKHKSTMLFSPPALTEDFSTAKRSDAAEHLSKQIELFSSFSSGLESSAFPLFVAVSGLLTAKDYLTLSPILWNSCVDTTQNTILSPTCFLIMQCAEKCPTEFVQLIKSDMTCSESLIRQRAIRRVAVLLSWRFQILSHVVIMDRSYRRPFKSTRLTISFVPTDMGSNNYVREEDPDEFKDNNGETLPLEIRKRLLEIGWEDDDKPIDQRMEWMKTPMTLLPSAQIANVGGQDDELAAGVMHAIYEQVSQKPVSSLRREAGGEINMKRRPVFVTPLVNVFPQVASLVLDSNFSVSNDARSLLLDMMRDDPSLLFRSIFNIITGDESELTSAITTLRAFLHIRHILPPATAHHLFTHLTGYLKFAARQVETADALQGFAYTIPIMAKLATQVISMSMREIRRAKIEMFLAPSFSLWFSPAAPRGPMFPRSAGHTDDNPFEVSSQLVWVTMIRVSQNMLFLSILKKNPREVHAIRKNLTTLVLPQDKTHPAPLGIIDFVPSKESSAHFHAGDSGVSRLSIILSRSYLLLVAQIFRSMSRHLKDRKEFSLLVEGISRILLVHGDDIGTVGQALIALMTASTRFRRIFTSSGGYTLFMPAIFKVYAEASEKSAVRLAIEYATNRFYALHQEAFVFQTLDIISIVALEQDSSHLAWTTKALYSLLSTLRSALPVNAPDPAGIHNANKAQEREALIAKTVEEKPQRLLDQLTLAKGQEIMRLVGSDVMQAPDEHEEKRFALDDIVRIFLTVIAHNSIISRALNFLRLFRYLVPDLFHASDTARSVLTEGVAALGSIFHTRAIGRVRLPDNTRPSGDMNFEAFGSDDIPSEDRLLAKANSSVDLLTMRMEYLFLVEAFTGVGGQLNSHASDRVIELAKIILRDSRKHFDKMSSFLNKYTKNSLLRDPTISTKSIVAFLNDFAPLVNAYCTELDLSEVFATVCQLARNPLHANDVAFARSVITKYCATGLAACELAASEGLIFSPSLRSSVVELMSSCVTLHDGDVISQLEKRYASYELLVGVVLPFALTLKPPAQAIAETNRNLGMRPETYTRTWIRLLAYVISAYQNPRAPQETTRSVSPMLSEQKHSVKHRSPEPTSIQTLAICLQIIKVIIVKAGDDLSAVLPDAWSRIGTFLKEVLTNGDATFALSPADHSLPPSPIQSPLRTSFSDKQGRPILFPPSRQPRVVDYLLWSLFELLCLYRTPLMLQMRVMMQEKVRILEEQLQINQNSNSIRSSNRYSRRVSVAFSKRGHTSRSNSTTTITPSVENSPNLRPTTSFSHSDFSATSTPTKVGREAGYSRSSPGGTSPAGGRNIVHLGPVRHSMIFRSLEPEGRNLLLVNSIVIKSITLIRETFRRIRLVQNCLGYSVFLPYPDGEPRHSAEQDEHEISSWTKAMALQSIVSETKQLMEEFSGKSN